MNLFLRMNNELKAYYILAIILMSVVLMSSCKFFNQKKEIHPPVKMDLCFGSSNAGTFIQLHIDENSLVSGKIVNIEATLNGSFINDSGHFEGHFISDSLMELDVFYTDYESRKWSRNENWILNLSKGEMNTRSIDSKEAMLFYIKDCDFVLSSINVPLITEAAFEDDEEEENIALTDEYIYFEFTSPDANKRTIVRDYIQMKISGDTIEGLSIGVTEGSPFWEMQFSGTISKQSNINVNVHYQEEEEGEVFDDKENWTLDKEAGRLYRSDCKAIKNLFGEKEYHQIEAKDIPDDFANRMR